MPATMGISRSILTKKVLKDFLGGVLLLWPVFAGAGEVEDRIREQALKRQAGDAVAIAGESIASQDLLVALYEKQGFEPLWKKSKARQWLSIVKASGEQGFTPGDYHAGALENLFNLLESGQFSSADRADFDLLLTDSLVRLLYHLQFGRIDPARLDRTWSFERVSDGGSPLEEIALALAQGDLQGLVDRAAPRHPFYLKLQDALKTYRTIQAEGGWGRVPEGESLRQGMRHTRVAALKERLRRGGEWRGDSRNTLFDAELGTAVRHFQRSVSLPENGIVSGKTLQALNVPVETRIEQISVNLERARWVLPVLPETYVQVDIANYRASLVKEGQSLWETRVQVGKPQRQTPTVHSAINHLVLNPTWTVPPVVLGKDILPELRKDPEYLSRKGLKLITRKGGAVNPMDVDWESQSGKGLPYLIRQDAGAGNALGRIKFIFNNPYSIYLHDTPKKKLFAREDRAFSSGCVRVEGPTDLALILLESTERWNLDKLQQAMSGSRTQAVMLKKPVPIFVLYWTVGLNRQGELTFRPDIYGRDRRMLTELNQPFHFFNPRRRSEAITSVEQLGWHLPPSTPVSSNNRVELKDRDMPRDNTLATGLL